MNPLRNITDEFKHFKNEMRKPDTRKFVGKTLGLSAALAITYATAITGAEALRESKFATESREQIAFANDIQSRMNENTVYEHINGSVFSIDLENDGTIDAYIGHLGARPGATHIFAPR